MLLLLLTSIVQRINERWFNVQKRTSEGIQSAKDAVFRGGLVLVTGVVIIWLSIFLYTAFYYAYMPSMTYIRPVNLQFKSCDKDKGVCSFPSAYVQLTKKQQLLMVGQPYKVHLQLEMPESPANRELGMFMVCAQLRSRDGVLVEHACRSAMLHYRSALLHTLTTLTFSPMMIFGTFEEKQSVNLELFGNFEEDQSHPVTIIYVEIQSRHIEFYSATIIINAHLFGLRYLMFHWPILSALVGIGTNLFFIVFMFILSYLHFSSEDENTDESFNYEKGATEDDEDDEDQEEKEKDVRTNGGDICTDTSSMEYTSMLENIPEALNESEPTSSSSPVLSKSSYIEDISSLLEDSTIKELFE